MQKGLHVIVGLGDTGLSVARFLSSKGVPFKVVDSRTSPPHLKLFNSTYKEAEVSLGSLDAKVLQEAETIVLSPGVSHNEPEIMRQIQSGKPVISDIELFAKAANVPIIAITGTNAKSTVTTLVGEMVKQSGKVVGLGGNLGIPALDLLDEHKDCYVLELSSFQLDVTHSLRANIASILNITPDHMDRYADFAAYQAAKHRIYQSAHTIVCNYDDPLTDTASSSKYYFSLLEDGPDFHLLKHHKETYLAHGRERLLPTKDLPIRGKHYEANALAALAIGHAFGLSFETMLQVLKDFRGLPHRCQLVREYQGVKWYNDSKGTNVGASIAAIKGLGDAHEGKIILIAGGVGKNADFSALKAPVTTYCRHVILIGEAKEEMAKELQGVSRTYATSLEEAVQMAKTLANDSDLVLLSPACASFDMFKNYAHRGEEFMKFVNAL